MGSAEFYAGRVFPPPARDAVFCTVVLPVLPATGQIGRPDAQALYVCAKPVPCPDHPQTVGGAR